MGRVLRVLGAMIGLVAFVQFGCTGLFPGLQGGTTVSSLNALQNLAGVTATNSVLLNVINQIGYTVELDVAADGVPQTLRCSAGLPCTLDLGFCPTEVHAVSERWLDGSGRIVGGRDYTGATVGSFSSGSFGCGDVLTWQLGTTFVNTFAL